MRSNWWDTIIWVILFIFLIPSSLAVAAWGSLPGQRLYAVKLFTESAFVALAFNNTAKGNLQVAYTGKRLNEATQLLTDESSGEGLEYFRKQVDEAKKAIAQAPAGQARTEMAKTYVQTLQNASHQLEQQRQVISASGASRGYVYQPKQKSPAAGQQQYSGQTQQVIVVNQVTQVTQIVQVIQQIDQTQSQITSTISQVEAMGDTQIPETQVTAAPTPVPTAVFVPTSTPVPTEIPTPTPEPPHMMEYSAVAAPTDTQAPRDTATPTDAPHDNGNGNGNGNGSGENPTPGSAN